MYALYELMGFVGNRTMFKKEERGIVSVVHLLVSLTRNLDKKNPVSLLASLVHSKKCRNQMIAAGVCVFLQKLVIWMRRGLRSCWLESLGKGKIYGVFCFTFQPAAINFFFHMAERADGEERMRS